MAGNDKKNCVEESMFVEIIAICRNVHYYNRIGKITITPQATIFLWGPTVYM